MNKLLEKMFRNAGIATPCSKEVDSWGTGVYLVDVGDRRYTTFSAPEAWEIYRHAPVAQTGFIQLSAKGMEHFIACEFYEVEEI